MENVFENRHVLSIGELKNNEENPEYECKSSNGYDSGVPDPVSNSIQRSKYFTGIKEQESTQEQNPKSSMISSVLDPYCKTNILDESADFVHCESINKFKNSKSESSVKNSESEILSCEICKKDITHLDVYSRAVHVNNCIDKQISSTPEPSSTSQTSTNDNVFILECPLCFKHFPSPEVRSNHIKKCGKSKGLSIQSIIKALELQERHALERISLGLPAKPLKPVKTHKSTVSKKAIAEPKSKAESDIQLARALSLSLTSSMENDEETNENITFVTLKPPTAHQYPGKKTKKIVSTPLLVLRTEEERKKLLLDKVATIVTPQSSCEGDFPMDTESCSSEQNNEDLCGLPFLWQLSGKALEKHEYYLENLLDWIQPSDVEVGAKLCHLSQIAGHEIVTQLPCDYTFGSQEAQEQSCEEPTEPPDSSPSLIGSLRSLVASSWMSDVDIHTVCGTVIPAHRLLLAVRCPLLKQDSDFCSKNGRASLKWENTTFDVALQFLNFIYTGNIDIEENMKSDLLHLANKYEVSDLQTLLLTNPQTDIQSKIVAVSNKNSSFPLLPHSQSPASKVESSTLCETQENTNMDLEIVYNCINSSLKPSQPYINEPFSLLPAFSSQSESISNFEHSSNLNCSTNSSSICTIDNCAIPSHRSCTSPVIFEVNDSENEIDGNSDNGSVELPANCSQRSVLKECNLEEGELDLCSTESNSSQDSVKFLQSSFVSHRSPCKTPVKEKYGFLSSSPKFPVSPLEKESLSVIHDSSRNLLKSASKCSRLETDLSGFSNFHSDVIINLESSVSPHFKHSSSQYVGKIQDCSDTNVKQIPSPDLSDKDSIVNQTNKLEVAENVNAHHLSDESSKLCAVISLEFESDAGDSAITLNDFKVSDSNILSAPEKSKCMENALKDAIPPEVLICDSDSDLESPMSIPCERLQASDFSQRQMKPSFSSVGLIERSPKNSLNFEERGNIPKEVSENENASVFQSSTSNITSKFLCNVSLERNINVKGSDIIYFSSDEDDTSNLKGHFNEKYELKEKFSYTSLPCEEAGPSVQAGSEISYEPFDDPQYDCPEYFEPDILSFPKPKVAELHSAKTMDNQITKTATPSNTQPQFQVTDSPVTPFPDYKNMVTPDIKQALKKIGVKALPRKKAVALLSHVYNETHPLINGEINTGSSSPGKTSKIEKLKKRKKLNDNVANPAKKQQTDIPCAKANSRTQVSDDSSSENPEWQGCVPEISFSQFTQDSPTKTNKDDIDIIKKYIQSNEELYNNILTYTPLNLVAFHQELKDSGIKISIQKLMDFLDEQCITFTCPRKEEYKKKQAARSQRFKKRMIAKLSQQAN